MLFDSSKNLIGSLQIKDPYLWYKYTIIGFINNIQSIGEIWNFVLIVLITKYTFIVKKFCVKEPHRTEMSQALSYK